jgi:hypothetical protein
MNLPATVEDPPPSLRRVTPGLELPSVPKDARTVRTGANVAAHVGSFRCIGDFPVISSLLDMGSLVGMRPLDTGMACVTRVLRIFALDRTAPRVKARRSSGKRGGPSQECSSVKLDSERGGTRIILYGRAAREGLVPDIVHFGSRKFVTLNALTPDARRRFFRVVRKRTRPRVEPARAASQKGIT